MVLSTHIGYAKSYLQTSVDFSCKVPQPTKEIPRSSQFDNLVHNPSDFEFNCFTWEALDLSARDTFLKVYCILGVFF